MTSRSAILLCLALGCPLPGCKRSEQAPPPPPPPPGAPTAAIPPPTPAPGEIQRRIAAEEQVVAQDPGNVRAWVDLGNDYFDTRQPQKAIDAYGKALEIQPDNPDVLTDQGVMYRDLGAYDKAILNFKKASQIDPKHVQSAFNLGVVYAHDLKDTAKAIQAWHRIIEIAPASREATQARQAIEEIQGRPAAR
jgi:cytochrome c-type biogenesis protein CcmH/NrfG